MTSDAQWKVQYRNPKWQKKRLEVMQANEFACQLCGTTEDTLNVHHKAYIKGRKVWEYGKGELECLCEACHETTHKDRATMSLLLSLLPSEAIPWISSLIAGYCSCAGNPARIEFTDDQLKLFSSFDPIVFSVGRIAATAECEHYRANSILSELGKE